MWDALQSLAVPGTVFLRPVKRSNHSLCSLLPSPFRLPQLAVSQYLKLLHLLLELIHLTLPFQRNALHHTTVPQQLWAAASNVIQARHIGCSHRTPLRGAAYFAHLSRCFANISAIYRLGRSCALYFGVRGLTSSRTWGWILHRRRVKHWRLVYIAPTRIKSCKLHP